jgi:hypothetical protein
MNKLYELVKLSSTVEQRLIESGGEITSEVDTDLASIDLGLAEGVDIAKSLMEKLEHVAEFYAVQAQVYAKIAKGLNASQEKVKSRIKEIMVSTNAKELNGSETRLVLSKAKSKVAYDETLLPKEYLKEKVTYVPDTDRLRTELEMGIPVTGATLIPVYSLKSYAQKKIGNVA